MLLVLTLLGFGLTYGLVDLLTDDDDDDAPAEDTAATTDPAAQDMVQEITLGQAGDVPDVFVESGVQDGFAAGVAQQVTEGVVTQEEADLLLAQVQSFDGPANLDTGAGSDVVFGGGDDDVIRTNTGDDAVLGGSGDDSIFLGTENDTYGVDPNDPDAVADARAIYGTISAAERGNDMVIGNRGADMLFDGFGNDTLDGGNGDDLINTVDQDVLAPDTVLGGMGNDALFVDQADDVTLGDGSDTVEVELAGTVVDGTYQPVILQDFDPAQDTLTLDLDKPGGVFPAVTVAPLADGSGSSVLVDGTAVVRVLGAGGLALTPADVALV